jgi:phosphatidylethanolamine-binding protein
MFLLATAFALSSLCLFTNAAPTKDTALGIAAIEAHFENSKIVPELIPSFTPSAIMTVTFPGVGAISPGQNLSMNQVATAPGVTIVPANSRVTTTGKFTLIMVDARAVGTNESNGEVLHWIANNATLEDESSSSPSLNVSTTNSVVVTGYISPQPPAGTGPHRYVILLLPQPPSFSPPANLSKPFVGVDVYFNLTDYISSSNLGQPIAGMYFDVQQGQTNITVPPTSAVVTSTLLRTVSPSPTVSSSAGSYSWLHV